MSSNKAVTAADVAMEKNKQRKDEKYKDYVKEMTPTANIAVNVFNAFMVGGGICIFGQLLTNIYMKLGADQELAALNTTVSLIFISVLLTGLNVYGRITKFAGAGTIVPITGFANSVASCAIEYKKEGHVFGIGCQIFNIAGPVILYGTLSSWILGLIYYILKMLGVI